METMELADFQKMESIRSRVDDIINDPETAEQLLAQAQDEVRERMEALFSKIERPVLGDLQVHWNDVVEMWPERVPDLYAGEPLWLFARLPMEPRELTVCGELEGAILSCAREALGVDRQAGGGGAEPEGR